MAFTAKDGKKFGNIEQGRRYDATRPKPKPAPAEHEEAGGGEEQPMHEVVAEHGTAHTTHIMKQPDGTHHVHSHHEDGHKHVSKGHDVHSAHAHSMHAHTGEEPSGEQEHEAFGGEETPEEESAEAGGIPTMA